MFVSPVSRINSILADAFAAAGLPTAHARATASRLPDVDLQCNGVMKAAQAVGRDDPKAVAGEIRDAIAGHQEFFEVSVSGPGFINMRLAGEFVAPRARSSPFTRGSGSAIPAGAGSR